MPCDETKHLTTQTTGSTECDACVKDFYYDDGVCLACPPGAKCNGDTGTTVETLSIGRHYWRTESTSTDVRECPNPEFCTPVNTSDSQCAKGHQGVYCEICIDNYGLIDGRRG